MMRRERNVIFLMAVGLLLVIAACKKEEDKPVVIKPDNRVFIINEGPFMTGSGSLDIYYRDSQEVENNAFESVNGFAPGNLVQSASVHNDKLYIVVNNAGKIEVAAMNNLISTGTIEGIRLPRYFLGIDADKAYVSSWNNKVYVVNPASLQVIDSIPAGMGPEKMMLADDKVWVLNQGGLSYDSVVTIIDHKTNMVVKNLVVGDKPSGIVRDKEGMVWVMCSGNGWNGFPGPGDSHGRLVCIDPADLSIRKTYLFPDTENHPEKLAIDNDGQHVYYNYPGGLYRQDLSQQTLQSDIVIASQTMFYALGYDHVSETVFVSDPLDYVQRGKVYIIDPKGKEILRTVGAGVIPGEFCFN